MKSITGSAVFVILAAILLSACSGSSAGGGGGGVVTPAARTAYAVNGSVNTIAVASDGTTYIGGSFSRVGLPATGSGVPFDAVTGKPAAAFPKIAGTVYAIVSDGSNGWYIGGTFRRVGGVNRNNIAHILSNGSVDESWDPNADGDVNSIAVSGDIVYVGGRFLTIGGQHRYYIAALNAASTGSDTALYWNPSADNTIYSIVVAGAVVYAGGYFTYIGGQPRLYMAALNSAVTGLDTVLSWNPNVNAVVRTIAVDGDVVYAGGNFSTAGGQTRLYMAAINSATTGTDTALSWTPDANYTVNSIAVDGNTVYAGGYFSNIGGQARRHLAALNSASTGTSAALPWDPDADDIVSTVVVNGNTVYAGGSFTTIGGQARNNFAALNSAGTGTSAALSWTPDVDNSVFSIAVEGSVVYAGGAFNSVGGATRHNIAAFDASGNLLSWDPGANDGVSSIVVSGSTVYAGGPFTIIGGQTRRHLAALNSASTGTAAALPWDPDANDSVGSVAVSGNTVYAGGSFTTLGGQARNHIAALNSASTGTAAVLSWNPDANGSVSSIVADGNTVYAAGTFTNIGSQARNHFAALNSAATGTDTALFWNPHANGFVYSIAVSGNAVYAGGSFTLIGGESRSYLAALNSASTGTDAALSWNPNPDDWIYSVAVSGDTVYAGGWFTTIGDQKRNSIAALNSAGTGTDAALSWDPDADSRVISLAVSGSTVYAGGYFSSIGKEHFGGFAALSR